MADNDEIMKNASTVRYPGVSSTHMKPPEMSDEDLIRSYLSCKYKGYLTFKGEKSELSEYGRLQAIFLQDYRRTVSTIICRDPQS